MTPKEHVFYIWKMWLMQFFWVACLWTAFESVCLCLNKVQSDGSNRPVKPADAKRTEVEVWLQAASTGLITGNHAMKDQHVLNLCEHFRLN